MKHIPRHSDFDTHEGYHTNVFKMYHTNAIGWILRIAVAGEFAGHGVLALQGKPQWIGWFANFGISDPGLAAQLLFLIGLIDLAVALIVLLRPFPIVLLWAALWGFWTALLRPIVGEPIWDFVERSANWGAPLALLFLYGLPRSGKEWWRMSPRRTA